MRKSKRKSLRSKRKSRKHGGDEGPSSESPLTPGYVYGHKSCGTVRGTIEDIKCQSKKVKAYSESKRWERSWQLSEHKKKLAESMRIYGIYNFEEGEEIFTVFLFELANYYYYKMYQETKSRYFKHKSLREEYEKQIAAHKQKLIDMGIPEDKLDQFYDKVTAEDTADVIKQKLLICFDTIQKLNDFIRYESYNETKEEIRRGWSGSPSPIKVSI